jgi:hypothetical protein
MNFMVSGAFSSAVVSCTVEISFGCSVLLSVAAFDAPGFSQPVINMSDTIINNNGFMMASLKIQFKKF